MLFILENIRRDFKNKHTTQNIDGKKMYQKALFTC